MLRGLPASFGFGAHKTSFVSASVGFRNNCLLKVCMGDEDRNLTDFFQVDVRSRDRTLEVVEEGLSDARAKIKAREFRRYIFASKSDNSDSLIDVGWFIAVENACGSDSRADDCDKEIAPLEP